MAVHRRKLEPGDKLGEDGQRRLPGRRGGFITGRHLRQDRPGGLACFVAPLCRTLGFGECRRRRLLRKRCSWPTLLE